MFEPAFYASLRSAQNRGPPDLVSPLRPNERPLLLKSQVQLL